MNEWIDRRQRIWAALAVIAGVALFLGLELRKEPGMSGLEVAVELLGIVPVVLTSVGLVLLFS